LKHFDAKGGSKALNGPGILARKSSILGMKTGVVCWEIKTGLEHGKGLFPAATLCPGYCCVKGSR